MEKIKYINGNFDYTKKIKIDKKESKKLTGYATIDKPWQCFYNAKANNLEVLKCTIFDYLIECNKNNLQGKALYYFGTKFTYSNLISKILNTAKSFQELGIKKGDIVSLALPNIPENIISFYALNEIGAIANMVDLTLEGEKLAYCINEVKSKIILATDLFIDNLNNIIDKTPLEKVIVASFSDSLPPIMKQLYKVKNEIKIPDSSKYMTWKEFEKIGKNKKNFIKASYEKDSAVCIVRTNEIADMPKGTILTNENLNAMALQYKYSGLNFSLGDKYLNQVPSFLAYNIVMGMHVPFCLGLEVVMLPTYDSSNFVKNIVKYKTEHALGCPVDVYSFLENPDLAQKAYKFMKTLASGSDKMVENKKSKIIEDINKANSNCSLIEGYGTTEGSSALITNLPHCNVPYSIGIPLPATTVSIFEEKEEKTYNTKGEICASGPTIMKGYYNNENATKNTLITHDDGKIWLHTGDYGYMTEEGLIYLLGRVDRLIKNYKNEQIDVFEIEKIIEENENVENCIVVGARDKENKQGEVPIANIVLKNIDIDANIVKNQIIQNCEKKLKEGKRPVEYRMLDKMPLTRLNKIDYEELRRQCNEEKENIVKVKKLTR